MKIWSLRFLQRHRSWLENFRFPRLICVFYRSPEKFINLYRRRYLQLQKGNFGTMARRYANSVHLNKQIKICVDTQIKTHRPPLRRSIHTKMKGKPCTWTRGKTVFHRPPPPWEKNFIRPRVRVSKIYTALLLEEKFSFSFFFPYTKRVTGVKQIKRRSGRRRCPNLPFSYRFLRSYMHWTYINFLRCSEDTFFSCARVPLRNTEFFSSRPARGQLRWRKLDSPCSLPSCILLFYGREDPH